MKNIQTKQFLTIICKDFLEGDLTPKELVEQAIECRFSVGEEKFDTFLTKHDDAYLGKLLRRFWEGLTYDTAWEGFTLEERSAAMKIFTEIQTCEENGIMEDARPEPDSDRSKGGTWPDEQ